MDLCFEKCFEYIYERFKVIRLIEEVYSKNEKSSHLPSPTKCRTKVEIFKKSRTIKKFEAIDIRLNELAEW